MLNKTVGDIALNLDMPKRVVEHVLQVWKETGEVQTESGRSGKCLSVLTDEEKEVRISCLLLLKFNNISLLSSSSLAYQNVIPTCI